MEVLTKEQLSELISHKHSHSGESLLDPAVAGIWKPLLELIPVTWSPNLLTLSGFLCQGLVLLMLLYHSPQAKSKVRFVTVKCQIDENVTDNLKVFSRFYCISKLKVIVGSGHQRLKITYS